MFRCYNLPIIDPYLKGENNVNYIKVMFRNSGKSGVFLVGGKKDVNTWKIIYLCPNNWPEYENMASFQIFLEKENLGLIVLKYLDGKFRGIEGVFF